MIGGAEGLDAAVIARAGAKLSLGRLTWPHMLVRPMLAEQIYRAQMILPGIRITGREGRRVKTLSRMATSDPRAFSF